MVIGCTKELKNHECRVGLTPSNIPIAMIESSPTPIRTRDSRQRPPTENGDVSPF